MANNPFKFKQFEVDDTNCAMKVGTDSVLLGAWVKLPKFADKILDVGSGSGIIALMMAQRSEANQIDGVEINSDSYEQCVLNFESSNWNDRLFCFHASFKEFYTEMDEYYDLIIANPPFFASSHKNIPINREMARYENHLPFNQLLIGTSKLLSKKGSAAFIIPYASENDFCDLAYSNKLFLNRITRVKGHKDAPIKRSLIQFSFNKTQPIEEELIIEIERHNYTNAYKNLVKDFYLKL